MRKTACGASTCSDASQPGCAAIGCWWSWTSTRDGSSASASTPALWMARPCAACSTMPFARIGRRNTSAPTTIPCTGSTSGTPTVRVLHMTEVKSVPYVPLSHPFVERLIGTLRRECLDRMLCWSCAGPGGETDRLPGFLQRASGACGAGRPDASPDTEGGRTAQRLPVGRARSRALSDADRSLTSESRKDLVGENSPALDADCATALRNRRHCFNRASDECRFCG